MRSFTFRGGVHPPHHKKETMDFPIKTLSVPEELTFPMNQHIGAPATPIVEVGDQVNLGQKIGEATSFISAPVHSSVSGTVTAIRKTTLPNGNECMAVVIQNDFQDTPTTFTPHDPEEVTPEEIVSIVKEAGIVGMGGASFPTYVKLSPAPDVHIDTVIINGAECEPYLTSDYRVMLEYGEEVVGGLALVLKRFGISRGIIAIEDNKPQAIAHLKTLVKDGMEVKKLRTKYPQGSEKQLIYATTKRKVPTGGLPSAVGVVVLNIDTCVEIYRAVTKGTPSTSRVVTVSGDAVEKKGNFVVRTGTSIEYVLAEAGLLAEPAKIIAGGPMMGFAQHRTDVPMCKSNGAILAFTKKMIPKEKEEPCLRCGKCVAACPMHLSPVELAIESSLGNYDACEKMGVLSCMECGSCAYLCPSHRYPLQLIKLAKKAVLDNRRKEEK